MQLVREALEYGNVSGAICVTRSGGIPVLPTKSEILQQLVLS